MPVSSYVGTPLSDGATATTFATVKAASTAPVAADTALVVSQSPNSGVRQVDSVGQAQYNFPAGFVRTTDEPRQVFYDPFDAALDTANVWTAPTVGNSAVLASTTSGVLTVGTGTTASGWSKLFSIPSFKPAVPAWLGFSFAIALPDGAAPTANAYRFWGAGTPATTPTTAAPMTDAVGFELTTAGRLCAVVYANGVRTLIADLGTVGGGGTGTQQLDANMHRYIVYARTDRAYWYIDSLATPVATSTFQAPAIQTLPVALVAVGGSTPPASNTQIQCTGLAVWDTGKNTTQLADGVYPFRKATISAAGALKTDGSAVTQPVSLAPAQAATAGQASGNIYKNRVNPTAITASTAIASAQAGLSFYLTDLIVSNAGATLNTVTLLDGATAVLDIVAAASGGGGTVNLKTPIKGTANTALNYTTSAASSTFITVVGYYAP